MMKGFVHSDGCGSLDLANTRNESSPLIQSLPLSHNVYRVIPVYVILKVNVRV